MIVRTWRQCASATDPTRIFVATDDSRVADTCAAEGIQTIMTSEACLTGTDRVAEAASNLDADTIINVQGDEPLFNPDDIRDLIQFVEKNPNTVVNGYCPIKTAEDYFSPHVPKVVVSADGQLLYMSRAPIPGNKQGAFQMAWRQVCAYSFPKEALAVFAAHGTKTPLEKQEDIEILRFLELGYPIMMIPMSDNSIPVDNPQDLQRVMDALE